MKGYHWSNKDNEFYTPSWSHQMLYSIVELMNKREVDKGLIKMDEDIVIVGAGIAGLTTSLGLHRLGIRSLVLESSDRLRVTGFALSLWTNAWRGLDVLGIGNALRQNYPQLQGFQVASVSGLASDSSPPEKEEKRDIEVRCVKRKELLENLGKELPPETIRYSSKVVSIEDSGYQKLVHLADGTIIKTKVLIGCDGVNSLVAKWLGLSKSIHSGRSAIRGLVEYPDGHGFEHRFQVFFYGGVRYGFIPCDDKCLYLFCTFDSSLADDDEDMEDNPLKMKQFIVSKISNIPKYACDVLEKAKLETLSCSILKWRVPWSLLFQNISKTNICVAGDAFHPMTPDLGQGGCSSIEDGIVLARCLGEVFGKKSRDEIDEFERIKKGLEKYANERRWRSFSLVSGSYLVGVVQESKGKLISFLRKAFLSKLSLKAGYWMADFDCGELV